MTLLTASNNHLNRWFRRAKASEPGVASAEHQADRCGASKTTASAAPTIESTRPHTPDLPVELWIEILSYLPPLFVAKMIGVNRALYEMAMDLRYEEVRLITCTRKDVERFENLGNENIGRRLKHLYIRPNFLPGQRPNLLPLLPRPSNLPVRQIGLSWRDRVPRWLAVYLPPSRSSRRHSVQTVSETVSTNFPGQDIEAELFEAVRGALAHCPNLHQVTLLIWGPFDLHITEPFASFVYGLSIAVGSNLRKLTVTGTPNKLEKLNIAKISFPRLEELTLCSNVSWYAEYDKAARSMSVVCGFFRTWGPRLVRLSLRMGLTHTIHPSHLDALFDQIRCLPHLHHLELWISTVSDRPDTNIRAGPKGICAFVQHHGATLQNLILQPRSECAAWHLFRKDTVHEFVESDLRGLALPEVTTLDAVGVGFQEAESCPGRQIVSGSTIFPKLRSLALSDVTITLDPHFERLTLLLLADDCGGGKLEELKLGTYHFGRQELVLVHDESAGA